MTTSDIDLQPFSAETVWVSLDVFKKMPFTHNDLFFSFDYSAFEDWVKRTPEVIQDGAINQYNIQQFFKYLTTERIFKMLAVDNKIKLFSDIES